MYISIYKHVIKTFASLARLDCDEWHGTSLVEKSSYKTQTERYKEMKRLIVLSGLAVLLAAQHCLALTVNESRTPGYYAIPGGEFTITSVSPDPMFDAIYNHYAAVATLNGGFQTFCLSSTTEIQPNPLNATLDSSGVAAGTAWLYAQFGAGTLANYDYGAGRVGSAWALQNAIWTLQGNNVYDPSAGAGYVAMAVAQFGSFGAAEAASNGQYGVDALRLTYMPATGGQGLVSQPMLALVPDGGSTLMLLGLALSGLGAIARRVRA
jgi:hypothetical protein